ncbi:hypothetical protein CSUI_002830 [Cystoisospora suis]|uniref:RRM domain-containing protein n=1 Tax=Cystoisospora suis TaxID=483139 RepID=A0A2C6KSJ5_9APIC|nr:hypothetical protein CSUI_002830 [Cystoisospora suis]
MNSLPPSLAAWAAAPVHPGTVPVCVGTWQQPAGQFATPVPPSTSYVSPQYPTSPGTPLSAGLAFPPSPPSPAFPHTGGSPMQAGVAASSWSPVYPTYAPPTPGSPLQGFVSPLASPLTSQHLGDGRVVCGASPTGVATASHSQLHGLQSSQLCPASPPSQCGTPTSARTHRGPVLRVRGVPPLPLWSLHRLFSAHTGGEGVLDVNPESPGVVLVKLFSESAANAIVTALSGTLLASSSEPLTFEDTTAPLTTGVPPQHCPGTPSGTRSFHKPPTCKAVQGKGNILSPSVNPNRGCRLLVKNISPQTQSADLVEFLSQWGRVADLHFLRRQGNEPAAAYVTMESPEAARLAVDSSQNSTMSEHNQRKLIIRYARPPKGAPGPRSTDHPPRRRAGHPGAGQAKRGVEPGPATYLNMARASPPRGRGPQ